MNVNLPAKVRLALYIFFGIGSLVVTYLSVKTIIGVDEVSLWTGISAFVFALAGINVNTKE